MLPSTIPIKRGIVLAGAVVAIGAPGASARPADPRHVPPVATASPSRDAARSSSPSLAALAADREAKANRSWQAANPATVIDVSHPADDDGFDLTSAGIGAAIALTLILAEAGGVWAVRRRREQRVRHQLS